MFFFFFFNDTATTEIYTLSLHDALPISQSRGRALRGRDGQDGRGEHALDAGGCRGGFQRRRLAGSVRSEEHTSELQSQSNLVCRLLLEKKKKHDERTCISLASFLHTRST